MKKEKEKKPMRNPMEKFFALGDRVTRGDPKRKADFDYYLMWIIFVAFVMIFVGNIWRFVQKPNLISLGWAAFIVGILWFQYNGLKQYYGIRKMLKQPEQEVEIESEEDMLKQFEK